MQLSQVSGLYFVGRTKRATLVSYEEVSRQECVPGMWTNNCWGADGIYFAHWILREHSRYDLTFFVLFCSFSVCLVQLCRRKARVFGVFKCRYCESSRLKWSKVHLLHFASCASPCKRFAKTAWCERSMKGSINSHPFCSHFAAYSKLLNCLGGIYKFLLNFDTFSLFRWGTCSATVKCKDKFSCVVLAS